jgi:hypothetical protein
LVEQIPELNSCLLVYNHITMNELILRVGTFNIRFDNVGPPASEKSSIVTQGETPWHVRRVKVADTILFHRIDLVGIQVRQRLFYF